MSTNAASTIFVGSSLDLNDLASTAIADPLLADGDVGFYGHMSGVITSFEDGTEQSLLSEWAGTGSGLVELSQPEPMAIMSVTVANTGTAAITVPVGQLVSSASGVQYQINEMPRLAAGWSPGGSGDGTLGGYTIQPGQSVTLYAQALLDGPSGNLLANQVTQIAIPGAAVTASSLITAAPQWGAGTVTLVNSSNTSQIIYEGVVVTGSSGSYQIGVDPAVSGFVATDADASSGYYVLAAGASITVPIASVATATAATANGIVLQEQAEDAAANSITGGSLPTGVRIAGSSAITTAGVTTAAGQEHVSALGSNTGFFTDAQATLFTTSQGYVPTEADVDTYNDYIWTAEDLSNWKAYVDSARAVGILNLAPMLSEFETVDFATSDATAFVRAAALYSGGITFDMPSWFFLAREPAYQQSVEAEIRWATQNGLRSSITLSPESGDDENFLADTQQLVAMLKAAGALPTQFVVKDGGVTGTDVIYSTTDPNSLNNVANWLSGLTLTPSNSESGLENRGTAARPDDLMTGVQQKEALVGPSVKQPFATAQLFAESKATQATLTVTLGNPALGRLVPENGLGQVSANGAVFTATGTMAELTEALNALGFSAAAGALGSTALTTTVVDAAGTITGSTSLVVDNTLVLSGVAASAAVAAPLVADPSLLLTGGTPSEILTVVVTLSNPALGSLWNTAGAVVSADGSTLTFNGTASVLQAFLRGIEFMPAPAVSGSEVETISVTDGTDTISSSTAIAVSVATGLTVDNVPVSAVAAPFIANAPYADILLAKTSSPSQVVGVTVTLSGGGRLVDAAAGTVSSNGLVFTYAGTFAQEQAALRALEVVVAPSAATSTQTLTFNLNGHVATTTLDIVSTDTVFVGATDSTQSGYASSAVAAPLLATGKVGLFTDYNGATAAAIAGTAASLASTWSGTAAGVFGFGEAMDVAQQSITVRNAGTGTLTIPVGTLASTASGVQFQVVQSTGANANWSAGSTGDGTLGAYSIAAGSSLTLTVEALAQGYVGNVAANAITTLSGIAGAVVTASSATVLATEYASGTVTLTNTSSSYVTVYEGTVLTNSTGSYQIDNDPTAAYYSERNTDSSNGIYYIPPGASTTILVSGINAQSGAASTALGQILSQTTTAANTLGSSTLPAGVVVSASSAIGVTGPTTAAEGAAWGGWGADTGILTQRGYGYFLPGQGVSPSEANTNISLSTNFTAADLASWDGYVDTMRGLGVLNVAPAIVGSGSILDISQSDATAFLRSAALYGGGIDVDMTPSAILSQGSSAMTALVDDLQWATGNGLRTTLTLRAYSDASFMENTQTLLARLQAAGALPSQVVVVGSATSSTIASAELANSVAQYVSTLALTPSTAESGLASTGTTSTGSTSGVDAIMTGVRSTETVTGTAATAPYAGVQVFDETAAAPMTAIVALTSTALGTLSTTGIGIVSADGSTVTLSGTAASIAAALAAIRYTPTTGATGTAVLNLGITDANGTITGETKIAVDAPLSISGVSNLAANGATALQSGLTLSLPSQATSVTATVKLSNPALGAFWNLSGATVSTDGSTATITGSPGTVRAVLSSLQFMPTTTASGTETETITVSDGIGTVTATSTLNLSLATGLTISNMPASSVVSPFIANAPYADILLAKTSSPSQVVGVTVTLSGGGRLVDAAAGTVSSNGLVFTYAGTFAQEQAALRALEVVVAPSAATSTQTLTFNLNGHVATTTLDIVSTDTVFVGATDSTQSGYASNAVAAPLLATGKVGLFTDYNGATAAVAAGTSTTLASTWSGSAAGVYGFGEAMDVAQQSITVRNTGTSAITVPVGTLASTASGVQFQVVQSTGANANWSAGSTGDGTLGAYSIAAGSSLTLTVEALAQGYVGNVAANAITTLSGIPSASITASAATVLATEYASGTVTLTNTGSGYAIIGEGTVLTNGSGSYQIDNSPTATGFVSTASDSSSGYYALAPGASTTILVSGINAQSGAASTALGQILSQTTTAANTLGSSTLPAGVVVSASSAIGVTGPTTAAEGAAWGGWGADTGILTQRGYGYFLPSQGVSPSEANTNISLSTNFTAADLASWDGYVDTMRGLGVLNVAPAIVGSGSILDISQSDATAFLRSAALYGGGIDVDMTPSAILSQGSSAMTALVDDLQWATGNGLRTTLTLRAYSDASFMENTQTLLARLQAAGALPSQVVVVGSATSSTIASAELANSVAQYVSTLALTPSTAESGLASTGTTSTGSTSGVDAIMTGVRSTETVTGTAATAPYAGVQVFDETATAPMTAIVALTSTALGTLSTTGIGIVSADGSTVTLSGTAASIAAALAAIRYTPTTGATGTAVLNLGITDANGTITGETSLAVNNPGQSLKVAAVASTTPAATHAVANMAVAAAVQGTTITVSASTVQHDILAATTGGTISNNVFQVAGSADTDMAALAGLRVSGAGSAAANLQIVLSGAPVSFTDGGQGQDSITSGGGNLIQTGTGRTVVTAGLGDTVSAGSGSVSASGPQGFTFLGGGSAGDIVVGGTGAGSFTAGTGGGSLLVAGNGATVLRAAGGNDTLVGGGNTTLYGADNQNTMLVANGGDTVVGAAGATIMGPVGGTATILAQSGAEVVNGASGAMSITGGSGSLSVTLGSGNASVTGGAGSDTVLAGAGGHYLIADGTGAELIKLQHGVSTGAALTLTGFVPGKDQIALGGYGAGAAQQLVANQVSSGGGTVLTLSDGATITLGGIAHLASSGVTSF